MNRDAETRYGVPFVPSAKQSVSKDLGAFDRNVVEVEAGIADSPVQFCIGEGSNSESLDAIRFLMDLDDLQYLQYEAGVVPCRLWNEWREVEEFPVAP